MTKIDKLTPAQEQRVQQVRDETFASVTSCHTDRAAAEQAVAIIVAPALAKYEVHWVESPSEGDSLCDSLRASLCDSLWDSLWASLCDSLWDSLRDSLRDSLCDSLWDSLWASGWIAFYLVAAEVCKIDDERVARIRAYHSLVTSCAAIWVLPGHVIICNAPKACKVVDGQLVEVEW